MTQEAEPLLKGAAVQEGPDRFENNLGEVAYYQADYATVRRRMEESLAIYHGLGNLWGISLSMELLGKVASAEGSIGQALTLERHALLMRREISNGRG